MKLAVPGAERALNHKPQLGFQSWGAGGLSVIIHGKSYRSCQWVYKCEPFSLLLFK